MARPHAGVYCALVSVRIPRSALVQRYRRHHRAIDLSALTVDLIARIRTGSDNSGAHHVSSITGAPTARATWRNGSWGHQHACRDGPRSGRRRNPRLQEPAAIEV